MIRAALVLLVVAASSAAHAQSVAEAKARIKEGKALLKQKQIAEACTAFAEAERLVPAKSTTLLLAECREKEGKLATAQALYRKAGAKLRARKLEGRLLHVTVVVPAERRVVGLQIEVDDVVLPVPAWGTRRAYDPGPHTIAARAAGRVPWSSTFTVDPAAKEQTVEIPALDEAPVAPPPPPPPPPPQRPIASSSDGRRFTTATIGLSVLGVGGLGAGIVFALRARSLAADADAICPNDACLDAGALDLNKRARRSATYANVGLIGGGVALVGAAVLFWIGRPSVRPIVKREQVGLVVEGAW